jgi:hypothetical protein
VVKKEDGNTLLLKWVKISATDFFSFEFEVDDHVRNLYALGNRKGIRYSLSYKPSNSRMLTTSLADEEDFKIFIDECKKLVKTQKNMMIFATLTPSEEGKKKSTNKKRKKEVLDIIVMIYACSCFYMLTNAIFSLIQNWVDQVTMMLHFCAKLGPT